PLESPIEVSASPRGKRTQRIHLLSGGERALTALSLLFAIYLVKPSPFCVLDEVDAPLDEANIGRFLTMLQQFKSETQFIVITHNPRTMEAADWIYGVTMEEPGVSSIVGVRLAVVLAGAGSPAWAAPSAPRAGEPEPCPLRVGPPSWRPARRPTRTPVAGSAPWIRRASRRGSQAAVPRPKAGPSRRWSGGASACGQRRSPGRAGTSSRTGHTPRRRFRAAQRRS